MTPIEQIIEEFNEKFPHYPKDPIYGEENARERKRMIDFLTSLQESTESRVREELRAAVEKMKSDRKIPWQAINLGDNCPKCGAERNQEYVDRKFKEAVDNALDDVQSLLQDPKKQ